MQYTHGLVTLASMAPLSIDIVIVLPLGSQQSTSGETPRESGQLFDPQNKWLWHSSSESQSPSSTSQGWSVVQKSSVPTVVK